MDHPQKEGWFKRNIFIGKSEALKIQNNHRLIDTEQLSANCKERPLPADCRGIHVEKLFYNESA